MLLGAPPFTGTSPDEIFDNIHNWKTVLPEFLKSVETYMTENCFSLVQGFKSILFFHFFLFFLRFLCEPSERLGKDIKQLQAHPFFRNLNWDELHKISPTFLPQTLNFDDTPIQGLVERPKEPSDPLYNDTTQEKHHLQEAESK